MSSTCSLVACNRPATTARSRCMNAKPKALSSLQAASNSDAFERQGLHGLERTCLEVLAAAHQQGRPAELITCAQRLHAQRMVRRFDLERDPPRHDQVELGALIALTEDDLIPREPDLLRQRLQLLDVPGLERLDEVMLLQHRPECLRQHCIPSFRVSLSGAVTGLSFRHRHRSAVRTSLTSRIRAGRKVPIRAPALDR